MVDSVVATRYIGEGNKQNDHLTTYPWIVSSGFLARPGYLP